MSASLAESFDWCQRLTQRAAGNFYYSFLTLPAEMRRDMCILYAFMRLSDDIGDDSTTAVEDTAVEDRTRRLDAWENGLRRALNGDTDGHAVFPALHDLVARRELPHRYLFDVLAGVRMDLAPAEFATFEELARYCYHVAGAVGLCCIHVWGFEGDDAVPWAIDCGTAFQLTNILRDLGEDARQGRTYLPAEDFARFGYSREDLATACIDDRFRGLMRFQVERARSYYRSAGRILDHLHPPGRAVCAAMQRIYGGLLDEIERCNYDVFTRRVALPRYKKLWYAGSAIVRYRWFRLRAKPPAALTANAATQSGPGALRR